MESHQMRSVSSERFSAKKKTTKNALLIKFRETWRLNCSWSQIRDERLWSVNSWIRKQRETKLVPLFSSVFFLLNNWSKKFNLPRFVLMIRGTVHCGEEQRVKMRLTGVIIGYRISWWQLSTIEPSCFKRFPIREHELAPCPLWVAVGRELSLFLTWGNEEQYAAAVHQLHDLTSCLLASY